jgi:uncharacterized protein with HEPN domain
LRKDAADIIARLRDIVFWGGRAGGYVQGMELPAFMADTRSQDAVIRCLEIVGEACGQILKIDPDFERRFPDLELAKAYRARNRTAHGYGSVDLPTVWVTATVACPRLVEAARRALANHGNGPTDR